MEKLINSIVVLCNNRANPHAVENILYAKFAHLFGFKHIKFTSDRVVGKTANISYYALNFTPSGGSKDTVINCIDDNLMPFLELEYKRLNDLRFSRIEDEFTAKREEERGTPQNIAKLKLEEKKILSECRSLKYNLTESTLAALYEDVCIIDEEKKGSIFIINTEFASFFSDSCRGDANKKNLIDLLYNAHDGKISIQNSLGRERFELKKIPLNLCFMSDFGLILRDSKVLNDFKNYLKQGFARRTFFHIAPKDNYIKNMPPIPTREDRAIALNNIYQYQQNIRNIFEALQYGQVFSFTKEADEFLNAWDLEAYQVASRFYINGIDELSIENETLTLSLTNSAWIIAKLAVINATLRDYSRFTVEVEDVKNAVEFYKKSYQCLVNIVTRKSNDEVNSMINFLLLNVNKWVTKTTLRKEKFVSNRDFSKWFNEINGALPEEAILKGFSFAERQNGKNTEICFYNPNLFVFCKESGLLKEKIENCIVDEPYYID